MFERFSDQARRVVVLAQEEARGLGHNYIGTEHLLLGVLHEDRSRGATVLRSMGVTSEDLRAQVTEIVGSGVGTADVAGRIPFTPRAKKVLELALRESLNRGDRDISDSHILLALVREGGGLAMQALTQMGVDPSAIRAAVLESLGKTQQEPSRARRQLFRRSEREPMAFEGEVSTEQVTPFERLDDLAWEALATARQTARRRRAETIRCSDVLAGVAAVGGPGADILRDAGADPDALVTAAGALAGGSAAPPEALWLDPVARAALTSSVEQALRLDHSAVTTVHLLGGLLFTVDDELAGLFAAQGVDIAAVHSKVTAHLEDRPA